MIIFFITNNYTPYSGGVVHAINATVKGLQDQGHIVFIITLTFLPNHSNDPECFIRLSCPIRFSYKNNHMALPWRPNYQLEQLIKKYKPDIFHIHHPFLLGKSALYVARKNKIPCIFTYHT